MKTQMDVMRLFFTQMVGAQQAEEMIADYRKRLFGNATKCRLDEEVTEQAYKEAATHISAEMPAFLRWLMAYEPSPQYRFD